MFFYYLRFSIKHFNHLCYEGLQCHLNTLDITAFSLALKILWILGIPFTIFICMNVLVLKIR